MDFILENIRLKELVAIVNENKGFYDEFVHFLQSYKYDHIKSFIFEQDSEKGAAIIKAYLSSPESANLYDGLCRPFQNTTAKWYFLSWLLRDAPAQRLNPLVSHMPGKTTLDKKTYLLNELRKFAQQIFPNSESWEWPALSEVLTARLEGSRRALKGNLIEALVRRCLQQVFEKHGLEALKIPEKEIKIHEETYDVQVFGLKEKILIPVKTRETMGGGHAMLFTRDIHKSISVAEENGYHCLPIIIAESWGGKLDGLACEQFIYIQANPNQITTIETKLLEELEKVVDAFKALT